MSSIPDVTDGTEGHEQLYFGSFPKAGTLKPLNHQLIRPSREEGKLQLTHTVHTLFTLSWRNIPFLSPSSFPTVRYDWALQKEDTPFITQTNDWQRLKPTRGRKAEMWAGLTFQNIANGILSQSSKDPQVLLYIKELHRIYVIEV